MAWRWAPGFAPHEVAHANNIAPDKTKVATTKGYCGLAGRW